MGNNREEAVRLTREKVIIHEMINFDKKPENPVKVSIVVPVCNVEQYLRECIDSCVNQTLRDIEIICINDGSTDSSLEILKEYAANDDRVKIVNKDNAGYGHTMNLGMDLAQGEYIGIVESDDFVEPDMFECLYGIAQEKNLDIIKGDYYKIWGDEENRKRIYSKLNSKKHCYNNIIDPRECNDIFEFNTTWSGIYRKTFLQDNNIRHLETPGASYQDIGFWFKTTCTASSIYYIDKPFYHYRQDNINSSIHRKDKVYFSSNEYKKIYEYISARPELYNNYIGIYNVRRYFNFMYTLNRIDEEFRADYITHFSEEFKAAFDKDEIVPELYNENDFRTLKEIVERPERYKQKLVSIPVVFSTDDNYAPYLGVAIKSLLASFSNGRKLYIAIFVDALSEYYTDQFKAFESSSVIVDIININNLINSDILYETRHFSKAMYYRIVIPQVLNLHKKIIYLDCDIHINHDISELYDVDLGDNVIAAAHNYCNVLAKRYVENTLGLNADEYFNSGILVLNCEKFLSERIASSCFDLLKENRKLNFPDQDILNIVCSGKVLYLDYRWNFQWHHMWGDDIGIPLCDEYRDVYFEAAEDPYIVHYTTGNKPWCDPHKRFSERFWETAKQTDFFYDILNANLGSNKRNAVKCASAKISVILPVYNMEKYLKTAVDSVRSQSLKDIEIICVNDGSTDSSLKILYDLANEDNRIVVIKQKNSGAGIARNTGIMAAKGEFIAFMDPDDFYPNNYVLEKLYNRALENHVMICGGSFSTFDGKNTILEYSGMNVDNTFKSEGFIDYGDYQFDYGFHRFIYNTELIRENNIWFPDYLRFQDPSFMINAMLAAGKFYALPEPTYTYRMQHKEVNWTDKKIIDLLKGLRDNMKLSKENRLAKLQYITYSRANGEFRGIIERGVRRSNSLEMCSLLAQITAYMDNDLIRQYNPNHKNAFLIGPLYAAIFDQRDINAVQNKELKARFDSQSKEISALKNGKAALDAELTGIRKSLSFRIGRFVTWLPRMIREIFKGK